jgi:hypothetical protein
VPLSKAQKEVFTSDARFRVLITGRRFGKTFLALNELAKFSRYPKKKVWYIAPTYRMCKDIMLDPLVDKMTKHKWISKVNYSDLTITLRNKSLIQLRSSENFNALRGVGLDFICIDEFSDVDERAWFEVLRPTLSDKSKEGSALFLGTPRGYGNWSYNLFTKQETDNNWKSFKYTTLDGGQVSANEIEQAKQDLDERTFKQEYLSSFVNYSGAIYYNFNREENVLKEYIPSSNTIHIGVDFNLDPMRLLSMAVILTNLLKKSIIDTLENISLYIQILHQSKGKQVQVVEQIYLF